MSHMPVEEAVKEAMRKILTTMRGTVEDTNDSKCLLFIYSTRVVLMCVCVCVRARVCVCVCVTC